MLKIMATRGEHEFREDVPIADLPALLADEQAYVWIDSSGDDPEAVKLARDLFHFDATAIDDCFEAREHPKVEAYENYLFVITHGIAVGSVPEKTDVIELDVFLGKRFLFTYHERPSRSIAGTDELVRRNRGALLSRGPAIVLHTILDAQADTMAPLLDTLEERIQDLEDQVLIRPRNQDLGSLLALKRTTLQLRRWMTKQRDALLRLARNEFSLVPDAVAVLFRDTYDHLSRYTDLVDNYREMVTSLQDAYLSVVNLRLSEIMKFLTLFTAVLMPLTLITGIYGMNFEHMPELKEKWGYPTVLGVMAVVSASILLYFRRRGWMGGKGSPQPPPV